MFVETDFYGTSSALRLRIAYGRWGGLMAGQTWSTFVDDDNLPRTIDFEAPTAFAQIRQAQVAVDAEARQVGSRGRPPSRTTSRRSRSRPAIPGKAEYPAPDLVTKLPLRFRPLARVRPRPSSAAAQFRPTEGDSDSVTLWGTMVSAKFFTWGRTTPTASSRGVTASAATAAARPPSPTSSTQLHAVGGSAFMGGYEHFWSDRWSTNGVYSFGDAGDEPFYTSAISKELTYGAVNLLWWFLGDRGWMGVEYIYGHREVFDDAGDGGSAHRVQYAIRFNLP